MDRKTLKIWADIYEKLGNKLSDIGDAIDYSAYIDFEHTLDHLQEAIQDDAVTFSIRMMARGQGWEDSYDVTLPLDILFVDDVKPMAEAALKRRKRHLEEARKREQLEAAQREVSKAERALKDAEARAQAELHHAQLRLAKAQGILVQD